MLERLVRARPGPDDRQTVEVTVHGGYRPGVIQARAGVPLRVVFRRQDDDPCSERVVFSTPRIDRRLAAAGPTTVDLPALPEGEIRFTCGMGRYRGRIEFISGHSPSLAQRLRHRTLDPDAPLGTAFVLWIATLPPIALVAAVALGGWIAVAVAAGILIAWLVGCVWAYRHATRSA